MEKINQMEPVIYNLKDNYIIDGKLFHNEKGEEHKSSFGLIAQDVEKIFPQLVKTDQKSGIKSLGYSGLIPVMIKAMQEITVLNDELGHKLSEQNKKIEKIQVQLKEMSSLKEEVAELKGLIERFAEKSMK